MTTLPRLPAIADASPPPQCPFTTCADMEEIKRALGLPPDADTRMMCEHARTLRQVVALVQEINQRRITCR